MTDEERKEQDSQKKIYADQQKVLKKLIEEKKLPELRPMTRGERKALDETGLNYLKVLLTDKRNPLLVKEDCFDWILDTVYKGFDFSQLDNNVCFAFANTVYNLSYADKLAEKN